MLIKASVMGEQRKTYYSDSRARARGEWGEVGGHECLCHLIPPVTPQPPLGFPSTYQFSGDYHHHWLTTGDNVEIGANGAHAVEPQKRHTLF